MKTLLRWLVKKFITKQDIKNAVHAANARLAKREAGERYLEAYANDGKIDDAERAVLDAKCDSVIDKYVSDEAVEGIIDAIIK